MARKKNKAHFKKGGVPPPGSADPPCKLEEEADVQRVTTEPVSENINGASPPLSPKSAPPEPSPQSVIKDCETPSTTEDASFASCLTEGPSSLSENPPAAAVKTVPSSHTNSKGLNGFTKNTESSLNSDSEYESAEEIDLPQDPAPVVTQQPSSDKYLLPPATVDQNQSLSPSKDQVVSEENHHSGNSIKENSISSSDVKLDFDEANYLHEETDPKVINAASAISESLVTVTQNEVLEESISQNTFIEQEIITEVITNPTVLNGEVNTAIVDFEKVSTVSGQKCEESTLPNAIASLDKEDLLIQDTSSSNKEELQKTQNSSEVGREPLRVQCGSDQTDTCAKTNEKLVVNATPVNHCENIKEDHIARLAQANDQVTTNPQNNQGDLIDTSAEPVSSKDHTEQPHSDCNTQVLDHNTQVLDRNTQDLDCNTQNLHPPGQNNQEEPLPVSNGGLGEEDLPLPPKKSYNLDFLDNLDDPNFNPFATKTAVRNTPPPSPEAGRKLPPLKPAVKKKKETKSNLKNSEPLVEKSPEKVIVDKQVEETPIKESLPSKESNTDQLLEITFGDSTKPVAKVPPKLTKKSVPSKKPVSKPSPKSKVIEKNNNRVDDKVVSESETKSEPEEDLPIPPSKGYNLDFLDSLEDPNFNPFATKTTVSNSPPKEGFTVPNEEEIKPKAKVVTAKKPVAKKGFAVIKNKAKAGTITKDKPDSTESKTEDSESKPKIEESSSVPEEEDLPLPPKKGYNLDFLDDPNFDPFKSKSSINNNNNSNTTVVEDPIPSREVLGGPCDEESKVVSERISQTPSKEEKEAVNQVAEVECKESSEKSLPEFQEEQNNTSLEPLSSSKELRESPVNDLPNDTLVQERKDVSIESEASEGVVEKSLVNEVSPLKTQSSSTEKVSDKQTEPLKAECKSDSEEDKGFHPQTDDSDSFCESVLGLPKVPSIGTIGHLDSLEFAQLLGNEASRLAEEFMNCSTDSGLPDSEDSVQLKPGDINLNMANKDISTLARLSAQLDENINPFQKHSKLQRSPPLGKRDACGAEGGDASDPIDPFKPRRMLLRESGTGEERLDTSSLDDDSGIALGTRSDLETDVNHSEAGPEIATGLTSSDLQCASQFFKEATDIENQLRKSLATPPFRGSQSKLSGDEVTPTKDKPELSSSTPEPQNKPVPSTSTPVPPHEERSAPEGTSSPTPRPSDTSEHKPSSSRPNSIPPEGYMSTAEVQKLLKQQELQFEEKLLRSELASGEKEKKLRQAMKDEQKELSNMGETMNELTQSRDALLKLVGQYKGMLASLVSEKEKEKQNQEERIKTLEQERNQALEDLANVEVAFSDVHRKYERTKQVVDTLRRNEETLRGAVSDYENKLQKQEQKFIEFQKHAEEKIQAANEEFETMRRANDQEMTKMAALLKKAEMKIMSLQDSNDRKTRENQELTQLCDDLINKVGTSH